MFSFTRFIFIILSLISQITLSTSQFSSCSKNFFKITQKKKITNCKKLTSLEAEFGWNYNTNHNETNTSFTEIDILFGTKMQGIKWLAWGVNPDKRPQMVDTRAIIGIRQQTDYWVIDTYNITAATKLGFTLQPSKIEVEVQEKEFNFLEESQYSTLFGRLILPDQEYNISSLNHVWQVGYQVEGMEPKMHPTTLQNKDCTETINLKTGHTYSIGKRRHDLRKVHGILNIMGFGTILPIGVIIARYCRKFPVNLDHSWYCIHVSCQVVGYILGTIGWFIGLWLGHASRHYSFHTHRLLAVFIFTFTTLQMLALRLKPTDIDEYRKYWNMYHHFLGYSLMAVISVNIFHGIAIFKPEDNSWKWAYIGILGILALVVVAFEIYTWVRFFILRKVEAESKKKRPNFIKRVEASESPAIGPGGSLPVLS